MGEFLRMCPYGRHKIKLLIIQGIWLKFLSTIATARERYLSIRIQYFLRPKNIDFFRLYPNYSKCLFHTRNLEKRPITMIQLAAKKHFYVDRNNELFPFHYLENWNQWKIKQKDTLKELRRT